MGNTISRSPLPVRLLLLLAGSTLLALGLALGARYGLVEADGLATFCTLDKEDIRCSLRQAVIGIFTHNKLGYLSLAASSLALLHPLRHLAWLGWCTGLMGLVLYCYDTAAPAALLALLILARTGTPSSRHRAAQA
ncbi:hypothetical protein [Azovibrio restrictus]|uniref:hypothetical protein n=1 Tax=Azovibrio restrictus TaxID=146938 RepID=UPI0026EE232C|nr:hypothetical protein [Azovibrio restrictus]